jgi:hypothetical protein
LARGCRSHCRSSPMSAGRSISCPINSSTDAGFASWWWSMIVRGSVGLGLQLLRIAGAASKESRRSIRRLASDKPSCSADTVKEYLGRYGRSGVFGFTRTRQRAPSLPTLML